MLHLCLQGGGLTIYGGTVLPAVDSGANVIDGDGTQAWSQATTGVWGAVQRAADVFAVQGTIARGAVSGVLGANAGGSAEWFHAECFALFGKMGELCPGVGEGNGRLRQQHRLICGNV